MDSQVEQKLGEANSLREKGQYSESTKLYTDCLIQLIPSGDLSQLVHCLSGQSLVYKILFRKENSSIYKNLTLAFAQEAYDIAEKNKEALDGITLSTSYIGLADALVMNEKFQESLPLFEKSYEVSTGDQSEKGRIKSHIGGVKFVLGDKDNGIEIIKESLEDIRRGDMTSSKVRTWETGTLNGLAKIYAKEGNLEEASKLAQESLQIAIEHSLPIRKRESEDIISKISSGDTNFSL
jgi:tetratricopeptide (TPR) repeat protein